MDELLRQRSNNRLGINLGAGDKDSEIFTVAQLRAGTLDMARLGMNALHGTVPESTVLNLPFLFRSTAHRRRVLEGAIGDELLAALTSHSLVGLCFYDAGARSLYTVAAPVRTAADLKGLRIRVQPANTIIQFMQALDARPVPMPYSQVMAALTAGTIDGAGKQHRLLSCVQALREGEVLQRDRTYRAAGDPRLLEADLGLRCRRKTRR